MLKSIHAIMHKLGILSHKVTISLWKDVVRSFHSGLPSTRKPILDRNLAESTNINARGPSIIGTDSLQLMRINHICQPTVQCMIGESSEELSDEDDELCPVNCVREFKNDKEFLKILEKAKETKSLVVVDFYRTACGSCKYIEQGFTKLCKGSIMFYMSLNYCCKSIKCTSSSENYCFKSIRCCSDF